MTELKCPFCRKQLVDRGYYDFMCPDECEGARRLNGGPELWEMFIRTRKALDVAKDKLDTVRQYHRGTAVIRPDDIAAYCDRAIEQITALEQKDVK